MIVEKSEMLNKATEMASKSHQLIKSIVNDEPLKSGKGYLGFLDDVAEIKGLITFLEVNTSKYCLDSKHPVDKKGQLQMWRD